MQKKEGNLRKDKKERLDVTENPGERIKRESDVTEIKNGSSIVLTGLREYGLPKLKCNKKKELKNIQSTQELWDHLKAFNT